MQAIEAKKTAEAKKVSDFNREFEKVITNIKTNAAAGNFQCSQNQKLDNEIVEYLKELGYSIEYKQCGMNDYETVISWQNAE